LPFASTLDSCFVRGTQAGHTLYWSAGFLAPPSRRGEKPDPAPGWRLSDGPMVAHLLSAARPGFEPAVLRRRTAWGEIGPRRDRNRIHWPPRCCAPPTARQESRFPSPGHGGRA